METKLPTRKPTRSKHLDYAKPGAYFITICTQNRINILSKIKVGEGSTLPTQNINQSVPSRAFPERLPPNSNALSLTDFGQIVEEEILKIPLYYPFVSVDSFVIMPNHIHIILILSEPILPEKETGGQTPPLRKTTVSDVIGRLKFCVTKRIKSELNATEETIFQRSFHDHAIRNQEDYVKIANYIYENPSKWEEDCFFTGETKKQGQLS